MQSDKCIECWGSPTDNSTMMSDSVYSLFLFQTMHYGSKGLASEAFRPGFKFSFHDCPSPILLVWLKTLWPKQTCGERLYLVDTSRLWVTAHHWRKSGQELRSEHSGHCFRAHPLGSRSGSFLTHPRTTCLGLSAMDLAFLNLFIIRTTPQRHAHRSVWPRPLLKRGFSLTWL